MPKNASMTTADPESLQFGSDLRMGQPPRPTRWFFRFAAFLAFLFVLHLGFSLYRRQSDEKIYPGQWIDRLTQNSPIHVDTFIDNAHQPDGSKAIVVASLTAENTSWFHDNFPDWQRNIYVVNDPQAELTVSHPGGNEASVYLTYIIDNYYDLPEIMVFSHAKRYQWHNEDPMFDGVQPIKNLRLQHVRDEGYVSLRCTWNPGCPQNTWPDLDVDEEPFKVGGTVARVYTDWFPERTLPNRTAAPCCAQFAVTRDQVHLRPLHLYETMREWLWTTSRTQTIAGKVMEWLWHIVFSKPDVLCPDAKTCFCEKFGLCELTCADQKTCEGRWYEMPYFMPIPETWPEKNEGVFGMRPYGWWHEWYPHENFGLDWIDSANSQTSNNTSAASTA